MITSINDWLLWLQLRTQSLHNSWPLSQPHSNQSYIEIVSEFGQIWKCQNFHFSSWSTWSLIIASFVHKQNSVKTVIITNCVKYSFRLQEIKILNTNNFIRMLRHGFNVYQDSLVWPGVRDILDQQELTRTRFQVLKQKIISHSFILSDIIKCMKMVITSRPETIKNRFFSLIGLILLSKVMYVVVVERKLWYCREQMSWS